MGRTRMKSPSFSLGRVSGKGRVRSKQIQADSALDFISGNDDDDQSNDQFDQSGRRIMVVVDFSDEAKCALQWTLSHTVLNQDTIVLLFVAKSLKPGKKKSRRIYELLQSMKKMCLSKRPEVQVEIALVAGKEKGPTIVQEVKKQGGSLLVLGRKKRSVMWRAVMMWRRNRSSGGIVEYCIENANCMTVGVRRKKDIGGYLITTKKHKDFWLLA